MSYLGVASSLTGRRWTGPDEEADRRTEHLVQRTGLPEPLCRVLAARDIGPDDADAFLNPKLRDLLPNPRTLRDMEPAATRFVEAVSGNQKIAIFADYDVDGGASAALVLDWLRALGRQATLYVPDRIDEGYGPNVGAMRKLAGDHDLILCVDCGTLSFEPVDAARGADVIILDHHLADVALPAAFAVVNPNRQDEDGTLSHLCAAGVVFLFLVEATRQSREAGGPAPDLMSLLDLVALATVADVAPLVGVNRAFVQRGLDVMARRNRPGLAAISDIARLASAPTAYHLGYVIGPRINAGGRVGAADLGARCLSTADIHEAQALAERLEALNLERREIETRVREAALEQAEARGLDAPLVWAAAEGWHPGVVGIVASRLKEQTNRPAVVIGFDGDEGKGSGRSVTGVDLGSAVHRLAEEGLLTKGGGHPMAAGLSLTRQQLDPAMARLAELLARQGAGESVARDLRLDGMLLPGAVTLDLVASLDRAGPYGQAAPSPRFAFPDQPIRSVRPVGEGHLALTIGDRGGPALEAIAFRAMESDMGAALQSHRGQRFHFAGRLGVNHWNGRSVPQLQVNDAARA